MNTGQNTSARASINDVAAHADVSAQTVMTLGVAVDPQSVVRGGHSVRGTNVTVWFDDDMRFRLSPDLGRTG